ncbi:hypothetical protein BDP27DRAFT_1405553 [Rhodocollybia butyracea]|uniref:Uncharacterized protein n=1 Tax=Rhodocollybia butyracea TaxID=206335 RepID=A0A9P5PIE5_9AGAR|nr:hypothetical protein BDP27DRAFT_1405553 [Rhodocollybia butyracea]
MAQVELLASVIPTSGSQSQNLRGTLDDGLEKFASTNQWSPPEKEIMDTLEKVRQDPKLTESFDERFLKELKKTETRELMDQELDNLTDTVLRIKQDFEKVSTTLLRFDNQRFRKTNEDGSSAGDYIEPLQPKWQIFQDTIEKLEGESAHFKGDLDGLRSNISRFGTVMDIAIGDAARNSDQEIKCVEYHIGQVQAGLVKYQTMANIAWCFFCPGVGGTTVGVLEIGSAVRCAVATMTPIGWCVAVKQLDKLDENFNDLQKQKREINSLKTVFVKAKGQITDVSNSINTIACIWSTFKLEAHALKAALSDSKTTITAPGLLRQIQLAQEQYHILQADLETYATKMAAVE